MEQNGTAGQRHQLSPLGWAARGKWHTFVWRNLTGSCGGGFKTNRHAAGSAWLCRHLVRSGWTHSPHGPLLRWCWSCPACPLCGCRLLPNFIVTLSSLADPVLCLVASHSRTGLAEAYGRTGPSPNLVISLNLWVVIDISTGLIIRMILFGKWVIWWLRAMLHL